jgi:hypothetical protein
MEEDEEEGMIVIRSNKKPRRLTDEDFRHEEQQP